MLRKLSIGFITALIMTFLLLPAAAFAEENGENAGSAEQARQQLAKRTILMYVCGTDLESKHGMASHNLRQILDARFSSGENVNFIIMTGGSSRWYLEKSRLSFGDVTPPDDAVLDDEEKQLDSKSQISNNYNQIWEARSAKAKTNGAPDPNAGKLVLLDGDGITTDAPIKSENELMTDPATLKAFINYGSSNYPAEQYDLILWDHGGGPAGGFGADDHKMFGDSMPVSGIVDAIRDNAVTNRMDGDPSNDGTFDFIDFDACLMSSIELNLVLADYTNYYIASAEIEPGYGQDYTGWLNTLGENPGTNAFTLGKQMVDDYYSFYENGKGQGQQGTLAVIDSKAFISSGITSALSDMGALLRQEAEAGLFYDEIHASKDAIRYQMMNVTDLGNFASLVSITNSEVSEEALDGESPLDPDNAYQGAEITKNICDVLQDPKIMYARGTSGICSRDQLYRTASGEIKGGDLSTSGMSFYFINAGSENSIEHFIRYYDEMTKVAEMMPNKEDGRYQFLKAYKDDLMDYALLTVTGSTVNKLIDVENKSKDDIDYALVKEYLKEGVTDPAFEKYTAWARLIQPLLERCDGGESAKASWLEPLVRQQAAEAVDKRNVAAKKIKQENGIGYQIKINNTRNRIIEQVERKISLEVPAIERYISEHGGVSDDLLKFGSVSGSLDISSALEPGSDVSDIIRWYNSEESTWVLDAPEEKWYAIRDAEGKLHAAAIASESDTSITVMAKAGEGENERHLTLTFEKVRQADGSQENKLVEITDVTESESNRPVNPSELKEAISLMPALSVSGRAHGAVMKMYIPTSESEFALSAETAGRIVLVYTDIKDIPDIKDTDGDGTALHSSFSITNMYGSSADISEVVNAASEKLIDISLARVRIAIHNGENHTPEVVYLGEPLVEGTDYTWAVISAEDAGLKDVGEYTLLLTGKGRFTGIDTKAFKILPKKAAIAKVKAGKKKLTVKAKTKVSKTGGNKYQIQYRIKGTYKWRSTTTARQTLTIRKLIKGKKYQIRIRAFKKVGTQTYYGAWSAVSKARKVR